MKIHCANGLVVLCISVAYLRENIYLWIYWKYKPSYFQTCVKLPRLKHSVK